jgi:hypothetical protein
LKEFNTQMCKYLFYQFPIEIPALAITTDIW